MKNKFRSFTYVRENPSCPKCGKLEIGCVAYDYYHCSGCGWEGAI